MTDRIGSLQRRGLVLEAVTLGWNVVGLGVLVFAALSAGSVALGGFGLDSLIEIGASTVVIWQLRGIEEERERAALRLIAWAFFALATYLAVQSAYVLASGSKPDTSPVGIAWIAATVAVMLGLAFGKAQTGAALANKVLSSEARVTLIDAYLAAAVLVGLVLRATFGWWWADPLAGLVIVFYGFREWLSLLAESSV